MEYKEGDIICYSMNNGDYITPIINDHWEDSGLIIAIWRIKNPHPKNILEN